MKLLKTIIIFIFIIKNSGCSQPIVVFSETNSKNIIPRANLFSRLFFYHKEVDKFSFWKNANLLRGANIHPYKKYSTFAAEEPITFNDLKELKKLGANLIVANYPGVFSYFPPYEIDSIHLRNLDKIVELTQNLKINLVIAIRSGPGRSLYTFYDKLREDEKLFYDINAKNKYLEMCEFITARYKKYNHLIGINFILEPHPDDPINLFPINDSNYYDFVDELLKRIRSIDTLLPIIVQPPGWASPHNFINMRKFNDSKIVYSFNMYFPHHFTNQNNDSTYPGYYFVSDTIVYVDSIALNNVIKPVFEFKQKYDVPIFVNEYGGIKRKKGMINYLRDLHNIFLENKFHFAFYVWRSEWLETNGFSFDDYNYEKVVYSTNSGINEFIEEFKRVWKIKK